MNEEKFNFSQFSSFSKDGKTSKIDELKKHLKDIDKDINVSEELKVGDEVKLKGDNYTVIITHVQYEVPGIGFVDYAGKRKDKPDDKYLCLFNQKDIEKKITKEREDNER